MRPSPCILRSSASSSRWLTRQQNDPFVRARAGAGSASSEGAAAGTGTVPSARSRASFKLQALARRHPLILPRGGVVVDLGAAPGGWSQVARAGVGPRGTVIAVDLLPISPIKGVEFLQGDFLSSDIQARVASIVRAQSRNTSVQQDQGDDSDTSPAREAGSGYVDSVLSDMMANMSGVRARDVEMSLELCEAALRFAVATLRRPVERSAGSSRDAGGARHTGTLVLKHFQHPLLTEFKQRELEPRFSRVCFEKPKESRKESSEAFFVCLGYNGLDYRTT